MKYHFYLTIGSTITEVYPLNFLETLLIDTKEDEQAFYRRKFSGSLTFINNEADDFDLLYAISLTNPCTKIILNITFEVVADTMTEQDYFEGYFSTKNGDFDLDRCTFEVTPLTNDSYADILDRSDTEYNIFAVPTVITTNAVTGATNNILNRNRFLTDVIEYIANELKSGVSVTNEFFTNATNYVTNNTNHLTLLTIAQKSDIIRYSSSDAATLANITWNDLMSILWGMFQVQWDYDITTDTIRIEHISWWEPTAGLDLRTQLLCKSTNNYRYLSEKMPKYEVFTFMEAYNSPFVSHTIWYDSKCVDQDPGTNTKEVTLNVTTDLQYIFDYPLEIEDDGFVILCNEEVSPGVYNVKISSGYISSVVALNCDLSWETLHRNYFRHNRVLTEGYMMSQLTDFYNTQKNILHECNAIICYSDAYDPAKYITTELGETYLGGEKAIVKSSELKPSGEIKFNLVYGETGTLVPITDPKFIYVYEVKGSNKTTYTAVCSEAATVAVQLSLHLVLQDADGETCTTDEAYLNIGIGETTDTVDITWCVPVDIAATCITVLVPDNSDAIAKGWQVYWMYDNESHC